MITMCKGCHDTKHASAQPLGLGIRCLRPEKAQAALRAIDNISRPCPGRRIFRAVPEAALLADARHLPLAIFCRAFGAHSVVFSRITSMFLLFTFHSGSDAAGFLDTSMV